MLKTLDQPTEHDGLQQTDFQSLQQTDFSSLQHAASLKGLLKPFKGKGELDLLAEQCRALEGSLNALAQDRVLAQASRYPFTLLPVRLTKQATSAGPVFLRWQQTGTRAMGVQLWRNLVKAPRTPAFLLQDLHALELQRIALNMQISLIHSIARQATECAEKMAQADTAYRERLQQISTRGNAASN